MTATVRARALRHITAKNAAASCAEKRGEPSVATARIVLDLACAIAEKLRLSWAAEIWGTGPLLVLGLADGPDEDDELLPHAASASAALTAIVVQAIVLVMCRNETTS